MTDKNPDPSELVFHEGQKWVYQKADLEQGAYSVADPDKNKVAVIFPNEKDRSIGSSPPNAFLVMRDYKSEGWEEYGPCELEYALTKGNTHIRQYRKEWELDRLPF